MKTGIEYAIVPMQIMNVTQRHDGSTSHKWNNSKGTGVKAIDLGGNTAHDGKTFEPVYAPTTVKVLAIASSSNTVYFGTCDLKGNENKVMCEDGIERVLTFAFTHTNNSTLTELGIKVGKIFKTGEICYREGTKSNGKEGVVATHLHVEVANGWQTKKETDSATGYLRFPNSVSLFPHQVFFILKGWNTIKKANGYTWTEVDTRGSLSQVPDYSTYTPNEYIMINITSAIVNIREYPGTSAPILGKAPQGLFDIDEITVELIDGYNWCTIKGREGWIALIYGSSEYTDIRDEAPNPDCEELKKQLDEATDLIIKLQNEAADKNKVIQELEVEVAGLKLKINNAIKSLS